MNIITALILVLSAECIVACKYGGHGKQTHREGEPDIGGESRNNFIELPPGENEQQQGTNEHGSGSGGSFGHRGHSGRGKYGNEQRQNEGPGYFGPPGNENYNKNGQRNGFGPRVYPGRGGFGGDGQGNNMGSGSFGPSRNEFRQRNNFIELPPRQNGQLENNNENEQRNGFGPHGHPGRGASGGDGQGQNMGPRSFGPSRNEFGHRNNFIELPPRQNGQHDNTGNGQRNGFGPHGLPGRGASGGDGQGQNVGPGPFGPSRNEFGQRNNFIVLPPQQNDQHENNENGQRNGFRTRGHPERGGFGGDGQGKNKGPRSFEPSKNEFGQRNNFIELLPRQNGQHENNNGKGQKNGFDPSGHPGRRGFSGNGQGPESFGPFRNENGQRNSFGTHERSRPERRSGSGERKN